MTQKIKTNRGEIEVETLTLERAKRLQHGEIVYQKDAANKHGEPKRWRVSGQVKTWKRSPERVKVPVKHGLYANDYITEDILGSLWVEVLS